MRWFALMACAAGMPLGSQVRAAKRAWGGGEPSGWVQQCCRWLGGARWQGPLVVIAHQHSALLPPMLRPDFECSPFAQHLCLAGLAEDHCFALNELVAGSRSTSLWSYLFTFNGSGRLRADGASSLSSVYGLLARDR